MSRLLLHALILVTLLIPLTAPVSHPTNPQSSLPYDTDHTAYAQNTMGAYEHVGNDTMATTAIMTTTRSLDQLPPNQATDKVLVAHEEREETTEKLIALGATMLVDYGSFSLWRLPETLEPHDSTTNSTRLAALAALPNVTIPADMDTIFLRGSSIAPLHAAPARLPATLQQQRIDDPQFWMVQFVGPTKDAWLDQLQRIGLEIVAYMPNHAYVVWGNGDALAQLEQLATTEPHIQWTGAYHPAYRLEPALQTTIQTSLAATSPLTPLLDVTVQIYTTPMTPQTLAQLRVLAGNGKVYRQPSSIANYTIMSLQLPADQVEAVATWADVYNVERWEAPQTRDEIQGVIMTGNITTTTTTETISQVVPLAPGYLEWLETKGFSHDPADYPIIDVVDDGIDTGDMDRILHPDFYELGDKSKPHRITSIANCTPDYNGNGVGGHGNINAGILASYNNLTGTFHIDEQGYRRGLGISPYGRVASTKIFENYGEFSLSQCDDSFARMIESAYQRGGQITTNSWGSGMTTYNIDSMAYDMLVRDASASTTGNQEMLHIFSAGNQGGDGVGTPGNAKNVLTVGATENVRDDGIMDGCQTTEGDNADDIADFSSRGPTPDKRAKPDIVAPGTHVQGPASQDPGFDGSGVCGLYGSPYYPPDQTLYTWSTGTSHSAPAVAGVVSLLYEYYGRVMQPGKTPSPAMIKAMLLNSTRYLTGNGAGDTLPSNGQGWGGVHMDRLFDNNTLPRSLLDQQIVFAESGAVYEVTTSIADPQQPLRVSLVWTDAPGATSGGVAVNNLDLEVIVAGQRYYGNVFDGAFSTSGGEPDEHNNVEQVFLPAGNSGNVTVRVIARNIAGDGIPKNSDQTDQDFALVITNDRQGTEPLAMLYTTITDSVSGDVVPLSSVIATSNSGYKVNVPSGQEGKVPVPLVPGTYTLTISAYGYETHVMQGVVIGTGTNTRQIAMTPLPRVVVQGMISDESTWNRPIYAKVTISAEGFQKTIFTNPTTGIYTASLMPNMRHFFVIESLDESKTLDAFLPHTQTVTPKTGGSRIDIQLNTNNRDCFAPGYQRSIDYPFLRFDDFQENDGGYTTNWINPWQWGIIPSDDLYYETNQAWTLQLDGTETNTQNELTSPSIDLSPYAKDVILLSWWEWWQSDGNHHDTDLYLSSDVEGDWDYHSTNTTPPNRWTYHSVLLDANTVAVADFRLRFAIDIDPFVTSSVHIIDDIGMQIIKSKTIYAEDFEADDGNFLLSYTADMTTTWEWGIPITGPGYAHSGKRVWATNLMGNHAEDEDGSITSPIIDLSAYQEEELTLSWLQWMNVAESTTFLLEISKDGGETWERHTPTLPSVSWKTYRVLLDSTFFVPQFRFRFRFISGKSYEQKPGVYLDDVRIEVKTYPCAAYNGVMVLGHIVDANTDKGMDDALLLDGKGHMARSFTPEGDPLVKGGFYRLFLPPGTHHLSIYGDRNYKTERLSLTVEEGDIVAQDFRLGAGYLSPGTTAIEKTLPFSSSVSFPITLTNIGALITPFVVEPWEYGYEPLYARPTKALIQPNAIDILLITTEATTSISETLVDYPDIRSVTLFDATDQTPTLAELQQYASVLVLGEQPFADPVAMGDVLATYVDAGGKVVQTVPTFRNPAPNNNTWELQGRFADEHYSPFVADGSSTLEVALGTYDETHPIMRGVREIKETLRQQVTLTADATLVAQWSDKQPFVATKGRVVALNTYLGMQEYAKDIPLLVHNSLIWLETLDRPPWFSITPQLGSLPISTTMPLTLSLDTRSPSITQPGTYVANLAIRNSTPYGTVSIPITLTVTSPDGWGKVAGVVQSQGYCGTEPLPLENAHIVVENQQGMTWTTTSNLSGTYQLWLAAHNEPVTITVSAAGHAPIQQTGIELTPQKTTALDMDIPWKQPCVSPNTPMISTQVSTGTKQVVYLQLTNHGHEQATIDLTENSLGFVPLSIQRLSTQLPADYRSIPSNHPADRAPLGMGNGDEQPNALLQATGMGTPIPTGVRYRSAAAACDARFIYLFGGWGYGDDPLDETWRYDTATDIWTTRAPMPVPLANMHAACIGSFIYLVGGYDGDAHTNLFLIYDTVTDSWKVSTVPNVSTPALAVWKGKLYTAGGFPGPSSDVWRYDPLVDKWEGPLAPMPEDRGYGSFVATEDAIYYVGGSSERYHYSSVYRYDPASNTWDEVPAMEEARMSPLVVWYGDYLYAIGGGVYWKPWDSTEMLDLSQGITATWVYTESIMLPQVAMAGACVDSRIWAMGGVVDGNATSMNQYLDHGRACHYENGKVDIPWLRKSPIQTTIAPGETISITLILDASIPTVKPGTYRALLTVNSNDPVQPKFTIPIRMDVGINRVYLPVVQRTP